MLLLILGFIVGIIFNIATAAGIALAIKERVVEDVREDFLSIIRQKKVWIRTDQVVITESNKDSIINIYYDKQPEVKNAKN